MVGKRSCGHQRKRESKKRKIIDDDYIIEYFANKAKSGNVSLYAHESNPIITYLSGKYFWDKKTTDDDDIKFEEWEKKEKKFYLDQCKAGAEIRLREGRIKPIDILSMHLDEPYSAFESLAVEDLEQLRKDIAMHLEIDRATRTRVRYWETLVVVCDWEIAEARKKFDLVRGSECKEQSCEDRGLDLSIEADVKNFLEGKSLSELEEIQSEFELQIQIYKAKACLKEIHEKIFHINQEVNAGYDGRNDQRESEEAEQTGMSYSPEILHGETEEVINPEDDIAILQRKPVAALEEHQKLIQEALASRRVISTENNFKLKPIEYMEEGAALFGSNDEVILESQVYSWQDKYHPRKPKYFNQINTVYEWNINNHIRYAYENPPLSLKIVKGYKFSILYPDLIDREEAPTYTTEKDGDSAQTCIIRFHAGPPYEDIAFRILNEEWECSAEKGFKCTFERGILHLNINFKQHPYCRILG